MYSKSKRLELKLNLKKVTTVRLDREDFEKIKRLAERTHQSKSQVIRKTVEIGLVDLMGGVEEDKLLKERLAEKIPDVDGKSFVEQLKRELSL